MSRIQVKSWKATHTGGTKFYHTVEFFRVDRHGLTTGQQISINHWGALPAWQGAFKLVSGQHRVYEDPNGAQAAQQRREKSKEYKHDVGMEEIFLDDENGLTNWLNSAIGQTDSRRKISQFFSNNPGPAEQTIAGAAAELKEKIADLPDHQHEDWGSW